MYSRRHLTGSVDPRFPLGYYRAEETLDLCRAKLPPLPTHVDRTLFTRIQNAATLTELHTVLSDVMDSLDKRNNSSQECGIIEVRWAFTLYGHVQFNRIVLVECARLYSTIQSFDYYWSWAVDHRMSHRMLVLPQRVYHALRGRVIPKPEAASQKLRVMNDRLIDLIGRVYIQFSSLISILRGMESVSDDGESSDPVHETMQRTIFAQSRNNLAGAAAGGNMSPCVSMTVEGDVENLASVVAENIQKLEALVRVDVIVPVHGEDDSILATADGMTTHTSPNGSPIITRGIMKTKFRSQDILDPRGGGGGSSSSLSGTHPPALDCLTFHPQDTNHLDRLAKLCASYSDALASVQQDLLPYFRPNATIYWTRAFLLGCIVMRGAWVSRHRGWRETVASVVDTSTSFLQMYLVEPIVGIVSTILKPGVRSGVRLSDAQEDVASYGRMVMSYVRETQSELTPQEYEEVQERAYNGHELELITRNYEEAIKRPIRSVVFGQLTRLMLIQIQKQKVDMNSVLNMTDGILEQHELNFHIMALMPLVLIFWSAFGVLYVQRRRVIGPCVRMIRARLRDIEIIVNRSGVMGAMGEGDIAFAEGCLLLHIHEITVVASRLGDHRLATMLLEDVTELSDSVDRARRLRTIDRMYRTLPFLFVGSD
eukprot:PhM_4_TR2921/c0_g1_i1/m.66462/K18158/NCA2; nuclear control of ATPase protein 2